MPNPNLKQVGVVGVNFGNNVTVVQPANLYDCTICDDVFVGPFTEIQKGVKIGARTKVQSHSFVCELVEIGEDCFIGHGVMFTNDVFAQAIAYPLGGRFVQGLAGQKEGAQTAQVVALEQCRVLFF